jgi:hypothetical protein
MLLIAELMSAGVGLALEVVDQVAGRQCGLMAHPAVFVGCGPLLRISTLFWATSVVMPSMNTTPISNNDLSFFMASPYLLFHHFYPSSAVACRPQFSEDFCKVGSVRC